MAIAFSRSKNGRRCPTGRMRAPSSFRRAIQYDEIVGVEIDRDLLIDFWRGGGGLVEHVQRYVLGTGAYFHPHDGAEEIHACNFCFKAVGIGAALADGDGFRAK